MPPRRDAERGGTDHQRAARRMLVPAGAPAAAAAAGGAAAAQDAAGDRRREVFAQVARDLASHFAVGDEAADYTATLPRRPEAGPGLRAAPPAAKRRKLDASTYRRPFFGPQNYPDLSSVSWLPDVSAPAYSLDWAPQPGEAKRPRAGGQTGGRRAAIAIAGPSGVRLEVPSLAWLCMETASAFISHIDDLSLLPPGLRTRFCEAVCRARGMDGPAFCLFAVPGALDLVVEDCAGVDEASLLRGLSSCTTLRTLKLGHVGRGFTDRTAGALAASGALSTLTSLSLHGLFQLSDAGLTALLASMPQLQHLSITHAVSVEGRFLASLAACCPRLESLTLGANTGLRDSHLVAGLLLYPSSGASGAAAGRPVPSLPRLTSLTLGYSAVVTGITVESGDGTAPGGTLLWTVALPGGDLTAPPLPAMPGPVPGRRGPRPAAAAAAAAAGGGGEAAAMQDDGEGEEGGGGGAAAAAPPPPPPPPPPAAQAAPAAPAAAASAWTDGWPPLSPLAITDGSVSRVLAVYASQLTSLALQRCPGVTSFSLRVYAAAIKQLRRDATVAEADGLVAAASALGRGGGGGGGAASGGMGDDNEDDAGYGGAASSSSSSSSSAPRVDRHTPSLAKLALEALPHVHDTALLALAEAMYRPMTVPRPGAVVGGAAAAVDAAVASRANVGDAVGAGGVPAIPVSAFNASFPPLTSVPRPRPLTELKVERCLAVRAQSLLAWVLAAGGLLGEAAGPPAWEAAPARAAPAAAAAAAAAPEAAPDAAPDAAAAATTAGTFAGWELAARSTLVTVSFAGVTAPLDAVIVALARAHGRTLTQVDLSFARAFTDDAAGELVDSCPRLRRLLLWGCTQLTDRFTAGHIRAAATKPETLPRKRVACGARLKEGLEEGEEVDTAIAEEDAEGIPWSPLRVLGLPGDVMAAPGV